MPLLFVDFETHYDREYSLRILSPPEYILDPRFEIHMLAAYDPNREPHIVEREDIPAFLKSYPPETTIAVSHNALFDMSILAWRYGYVPAGMLDTLGMSRALHPHLRSHALGSVAEHLHLGTKLDNATVLKSVIGMHRKDIRAAGLWPQFKRYALRDVRLCADIFFRLEPLFPVEERHCLDLVLRCAIEPSFRADIPLLRDHLARLRQHKLQSLREAGCDRASLMSTDKFRSLLEGLGVTIEHKVSKATGKDMPCFAKTDKFMHDLCSYSADPDEDVCWKVQALASARLNHKSTLEETRASRFANIASLPWKQGPVLPVPLRYAGAHTHRLAGEWSCNFQNLPRDKTKSKLRHALRAPDGFKVVAADLAQIEARLTSVFCGEHGLTQEFRNGVDVYSSFASRIFYREITKVKHPVERFIGKTSILGLGYGCGPDKFWTMLQIQSRSAGISLGDFDKDKTNTTVQTYRRTYSNIARMWKTLERYLDRVIFGHRVLYPIGPVTFQPGKVILPNKLELHYNRDDRDKIYGAKLLENIVQSLARIVIMQAALRIHARGYRFVLQAHDELAYIVPNHDVENAKHIIMNELTRAPEWMPDLPVAAEIGIGQTYGDCK